MMRLGPTVVRSRWIVVLLWVLLAWVMIQFIPKGDPADSECASFLPAECAYSIAMDKLAESFPRDCALATAVLVAERPGKALTAADSQWLEALAAAIREEPKRNPELPDDIAICVSSPGQLDASIDAANKTRAFAAMLAGKRSRALRNPTRSRITTHGQAAIIRVAIPTDFITLRSARITGSVRRLASTTPRPEGLRVAVTGTGGFGYDYADFVKRSQSRTSLATIISVILILLVVYRGILAALIPLVSISLAVVVMGKGINLGQNCGCSIGTAEKLFVFVLMYGAGIDYSILLISRFREYLQRQHQPRDAAAKATDATTGAIFASAGTDAMGIFMLVFSQFLIFRTTGPVVAISLILAMIAALSLVPALIAIAGKWMFWPRKIKPVHEMPSRFWNGIAHIVLRHPKTILISVLLLASVAMVNSRNITWVYNAITGIPVEYRTEGDESTSQEVGNAPAGVEIVTRHWGEGEVAPVKLLLEWPTPLTGEQSLQAAKSVSAALAALDDVQNVRSYYEPFGLRQALAETPGSATIRRGAAKTYLADKGKQMRFEVILEGDSMSNDSIGRLAILRSTITQAAAGVGVDGMKIHLGGATAQMEATREITTEDFRMMVICVLGVIVVIVFVLLRDLRMTLLMAGLIVVSYLTTLGLVEWIYPLLFGNGGLDWKVQMFLFVVMAAVGVDYNIFLAARIEQEAQRHEWKEAVRRAMVATGPVISSAGLIMAVTLGSLTVGHIVLLRQMGLALSLGILVDTFVIRPLVLPSAALLLRKKK